MGIPSKKGEDMSLKAVIDGTLLAECERLGKIRFGMFRVAEEITKRLITKEELELYFANTKQNKEYDRLLRAYFSKFETKKYNILSYPFSNTTIPKLEGLSVKIIRHFFKDKIFAINRFNLFHSFYTPFSSQLAKTKVSKSITLLDIIPLRMDGYPELVNDLKQIVESVAPNFAIAISQFTKNDICDYDRRIDPERVFVVPLAANKDLFYINKNEDDWQSIKHKYDLPDTYFLSLSGLDKRKNLQHLIYSFDKLVMQEKVKDLHLVMTGNISFENTIFKQLNINDRTKQKIVFAKPIEDKDLSVVYSHALCFFFMSLYEGFGLPPLEAMQCGVPVITSNTSSLPEVVGDAGIMISPSDEDALCNAMLKIYNNQQLRNQLSILGLKRAEHFSWERCANEYMNIFRKIAT